jgi:hypothetical protein
MLETKAKKRAKGMISRPGEIMDTKSFHRTGRAAVNAEGQISRQERKRED